METFKPAQSRVEQNQWSACGKASMAQQATPGGVLVHRPSDWATPCPVHVTRYSPGCQCVEDHWDFLLLLDFFLWETCWYVVGGDHHPPWAPTLSPRCTGKDWCEKMTKAPVRQSDTTREVSYAAQHNSRRRWEDFCPIQTGAQSLCVIYQVTGLHSRDLLSKHPHLFFKDGRKWEKPQWLTLREVQNEEFCNGAWRCLSIRGQGLHRALAVTAL